MLVQMSYTADTFLSIFLPILNIITFILLIVGNVSKTPLISTPSYREIRCIFVDKKALAIIYKSLRKAYID